MSKLKSAVMIFGLFLLLVMGSIVNCSKNHEKKNTFLIKRSKSPTCELSPSAKEKMKEIEEEVEENQFEIKQIQRDVLENHIEVKEQMAKVLKQLKIVQNAVNDISGLLNQQKKGKNCADLFERGTKQNGVYRIDPDGLGSFNVRCDMTTSGGGWTVFQRRLDGSVDFYRGWQDYKHGFGDLNGEFWLGLDKICRLTSHEKTKLRIDMGDTSGNTRYAEYDFFAVTSDKQKYQLSLGTYSGTAGDSFTVHEGMPFSTKDSDNDKKEGNCAVSFKGAWWYKSFHYSNLNGLYHHGANDSFADGVNWLTWKGYKYSLKSTSMKIRPRVFRL